MCRSSAEHRLKIEGLGAQTQTILLACREKLGGIVWLLCVRERESDMGIREESVAVPVPVSLCSGRIWSGLVWSGLIWMDLGLGLHCSCTTAGLQPLLHPRAQPARASGRAGRTRAAPSAIKISDRTW